MTYRIQDYNDGAIYRNGSKFEFVKNTEVKGSYDSIKELVEANKAESIAVEETAAQEEIKPRKLAKKLKESTKLSKEEADELDTI